MGHVVELKAADGHELDAYLAKPKGEPIGALVVIQEIFGVNASIREVADTYAEQGFVAIAPALFDRFGKGIELGYDEAGMKRAFELYPKLDPKISLLDVAAAFLKAKEYQEGVSVLGFCYGGVDELAGRSAWRGTRDASGLRGRILSRWCRQSGCGRSDLPGHPARRDG